MHQKLVFWVQKDEGIFKNCVIGDNGLPRTGTREGVAETLTGDLAALEGVETEGEIAGGDPVEEIEMGGVMTLAAGDTLGQVETGGVISLETRGPGEGVETEGVIAMGPGAGADLGNLKGGFFFIHQDITKLTTPTTIITLTL